MDREGSLPRGQLGGVRPGEKAIVCIIYLPKKYFPWGNISLRNTVPGEMFLKFVLFTERFAEIGDYGWNLTSEMPASKTR